MKNIKILGISLLLIVTFMLGACSQTQTFADQLNPIKIWLQNENGTTKTYIVVDDNTGVNYIVVGMNNYGGISVTPRLNTDGTLYTSK